MANPLIQESQSLLLDKWRYDDAETNYQLTQSGVGVNKAQVKVTQAASSSSSSLVSEIAKARQHIQNSLKSDTLSGVVDNVLVSKVEALELDNKELRKVTSDLQAIVKKLERRIAALEAANKPAGQQKVVEKSVPKKVETGDDDDDDDDDDDFDCFASDDDDEEKERLKEERVKNYYDKKAKKPTVIAKSNVILDVKPWGDDTDLAEMEKCVRSIEMDGLLWGTSKLVPVGYGIKKLVISTVVEDEKVSIDDLQELIQEFEDHVQSVDIAAFNKL